MVPIGTVKERKLKYCERAEVRNALAHQTSTPQESREIDGKRQEKERTVIGAYWYRKRKKIKRL